MPPSDLITLIEEHGGTVTDSPGEVGSRIRVRVRVN